MTMLITVMDITELTKIVIALNVCFEKLPSQPATIKVAAGYAATAQLAFALTKKASTKTIKNIGNEKTKPRRLDH